MDRIPEALSSADRSCTKNTPGLDFFVADFLFFSVLFSNYVMIMERTFENILDCRKGAVCSVNPRLLTMR